MSQYSSMTVVQLKEALKEKGLSVEGKKAELVSRLSEAEPASESGDLEKPQNDEPAETAENGVRAENGDTAVSSTGNEDAEPVTEAKVEVEQPQEKEEKPKVLSADERKQLAVELLTKKIKRAEKFGDEASATAARKDLARVEKFGVDIGTALAKEIGALDRSVNSELGVRKPKKGGKNRV